MKIKEIIGNKKINNTRKILLQKKLNLSEKKLLFTISKYYKNSEKDC